MASVEVRVLLNPRAGAGAASRRLTAVETMLRARGVRYDVARTTAPGEAGRLARRAADDGVATLAVIGGDGTLNEVAHGYLDGEGNARPGPALVLVHGGTGGDYRKTFALPARATPEQDMARAFEGEARPVDLGRLRVVGDDGAPRTHAFLNIASFGLGGVTDRLVNDAPKWLGGRASFFVGVLRALARYRNAPVRVAVDGATFYEGPVVNVAVAIGRYFGGGMHVAPHADPSDGLFDVVALGDLSLAQNLALTRHIYAGTHPSVAGVTTTRGARVEATPLGREPVLIDMDGETPGRLPLTAEVLPGALRIYQ